MAALCWAAGTGNEALATLLREKGENITVEDDTAGLLVYKGPSVFDKGIEFYSGGSRLEFYDASAETQGVVWAVKNKHLNLTRMLLLGAGEGLDINCRFFSGSYYTKVPLQYAIEYGDVEMVKLLLQHGAEINTIDGHQKSWSPLHLAANYGHVGIVKMLLQKGVDVFAQDYIGRMAIDLAQQHGLGSRAASHQLLRKRCGNRKRHEDIVRLLLEPVTITFMDHIKRTGLQLAAIYSHEAVFRRLLDEGADIWVRDQNGRTALHHAAKQGNETFIRLLLEKNPVGIADRDRDRRTPLHAAAQYGPEALGILLDHGADINAIDVHRRTALDLAAKYQRETVGLLLERGADGSRMEGYFAKYRHFFQELLASKGAGAITYM